MREIEELKGEIESLKQRNKVVDANKAWETSNERRVLVAITTYLLMVLLLMTISADRPFISAVVPTIGYMLSTISFGLVKTRWIAKRKNGII